jgi:hypothetical protein
MPGNYTAGSPAAELSDGCMSPVTPLTESVRDRGVRPSGGDAPRLQARSSVATGGAVNMSCVMDDERSAAYALAYEEAKHAVSTQQTVVDNFRARAGLLLSGAAIATSFLGGQALRGGEPGPWSWLAITAFGALGVLTLAILWPTTWEFAILATSSRPTQRAMIRFGSQTSSETSHCIGRMSWRRMGADSGARCGRFDSLD